MKSPSVSENVNTEPAAMPGTANGSTTLRNVCDGLAQVVVARARAEQRAEIRAADREEAGVELPLRRDPRPRTVAAEGLRDRGDGADLPRTVAVPVALRDLAAIRRLDRLEREDGVDPLDDLRGRDDVVEAPAVGRADVHVLDEAQGVTGAAEVAGHVDDACVVDPALDDRVHLDGKPDRRCGSDSLQHALDGEVDVVHRAERRVVERVEADVDTIEARRAKHLGLAGEQRGVRRQGQVEALDLREPLDEHLELLAQERLAPGEADLLDAEPRERPGDARSRGEPRVVALEHGPCLQGDGGHGRPIQHREQVRVGHAEVIE